MTITRLLLLCCLLASSAAAEDHGLIATYYGDIDFTGPSVTRVDPTVDFTWPAGTQPAPGIGPEDWSAIWTGALVIPAAGAYRFTTLSDDGVTLIIDGAEVIDDWTGHGPTEDQGDIQLAAGPHALEMRFYNSHLGATARLWWESDAIAREIIPYSALLPLLPPAQIGQGSGLWASYYPSADFTGTPVERLDQTVDFAWSAAPAPGIPHNAFTAEWRGWIEPQYSETYTFTLSASGGVELDLDGVPEIDHLTSVATGPLSTPIFLAAGHRHELRLRLRHVGAAPSIRLLWSCPLTAPMPIPTSQLYPESATAGAAIAWLTPPETRTSPAWIEGTVAGGDAALSASIGGAPVDAVRSARGRWHLAAGGALGVPLQPGANTVSVTARSGAQVSSLGRTVTWLATDVAQLPYGLDRLLLPAGDSVLLTASGSSGSLELDIGDGRAFSGAAGQAIAVAFPSAGATTVIARIDGVEVGRIPVVVVAADLRGPIADHLLYQRIKDVAVQGGAPADVVFAPNDAGLLEVGAADGAPPGDLRLTLRALTRGDLALEARLGDAAGPLVASCPVDEFTLETDADRTIRVIDTYPDGSQLVEAHLTMTPLVPGLEVRLAMYTGGATFADGTLQTSIWSSAFAPDGVSGVAPYDIIRSPNAWVCHSIRAYQAGVQISNH